MIHKIVSFYAINLPNEIVILQKKVFEKLNIPLIQVPFSGTHDRAITEYLSRENNEWDKITIFDVDCIPLTNEPINFALNTGDDEIYGNAQISNSTPYAAPSFLTFSRNLYETSEHKDFRPMYYPNDRGEMVEADCAEVFVKENLKRGKKMILSYPISSLIPQWAYKGDKTHPPFQYGNGTLFDNNTYHSFQIRLPSVQYVFIEYVKKFLDEKN